MTLRKIDLTGQAPVATIDPGQLPRVILVPLDQLVIDETYQRPLSRGNWEVIRKIAARFQWSRFQPIMVSPLPDGGYAVIDGQHRAHAAALAGQVAVPAAVVPIPRSEQARAFADINSLRTGVTQFHLFKAGLAAGDPEALECARVVEQGGCRLMTYVVSAQQRKPRDIYALALIREFVRAGRGALVTSALSAITDSGAHKEIPFYSERFLRCWFGLLQARPDLLYRDLPQIIDKLNYTAVTAMAEALARHPDWHDKPFRARMMQALADRVDRIIAPPKAKATAAPSASTGAPLKVRAPAPRPDTPAPRADVWSDERDAALIETGGKYAGMAELADKWGMPIKQVTARWHKVRAA